MNEPAPGEPWAFICHKGGRWGGITAANEPNVGQFLSRFAKKGYAIKTVFSRAEYLEFLDTLETGGSKQ